MILDGCVMLPAAQDAIKKWLMLANPWWETGRPDEHFDKVGPVREHYLDLLLRLIHGKVRRAVVAMGPRRVGKTVLMHHAIRHLLASGVPPRNIFYASIDQPLFTGMTLEALFELFRSMHDHRRQTALYVFIDEIQYHPDWARHLKALYDTFPTVRFIASGSAAAALRLKSAESGAGRFIDLLIPPLSFLEYVLARNIGAEKINEQHFVDYINYGGFPEAIATGGYDRFIAESIVDKVLLHDLPHLYGIEDPQELKRFFVFLAYSVGREVGLDGLSKASGVAKNTVKKYLEYLEAAFLIQRLQRVDENARHFQRQTNFKVYLVNTSLRAALFGPMQADDPDFSFLVENALLSQFMQSEYIGGTRYARWKDGEIDIVLLDRLIQGIWWAVEVKWTNDRVANIPKNLAPLLKQRSIQMLTLATRGLDQVRVIEEIDVEFCPAWHVALTIGLGFITPFLSNGKNARPLLPLTATEKRDRFRILMSEAIRRDGFRKKQIKPLKGK